MTKNMTQGNPFKLILLFSLPLFIGNMVLQLYSTIDALIVRTTISTEAFTAVGSTGSILFLILGFVMGVSAGLSVITAQYYGADDIKSVRRSIATSIMISIFITIILTAISMFYCRPLLEFMQTPTEIIDRSYDYLIVVLGGIFANFMYTFYSTMMRALGNSKTPLYFLIIAAILNIFLDFVLIYYAKLDVSGASYATIISQLACGVFLMLYANKKIDAFKLTKEDFVFDKEFIKKHLNSAIPMGFQFSIIAIGTIIVQITLNTFGTDYVTAYTASTKIEMILSQLYPAIGTAVVTFVAQNYGAGKIDRIKIGVNNALAITSVYTILASIIFVFGGQSILYVIIGKNEIPEIYQNAQIYLNYCAMAFFFLGIIYVYRNALQGISRGKYTFTAGIIELVVRSVTVIVLSKMLGFSGICVASPLTWVITGVFLMISFKNIMRKMV